MPTSRRISPSSSPVPTATGSPPGSPPRPRPRRRWPLRILAVAGIVISDAYLAMVAWHAVAYAQNYPSNLADPGLLPFALQLPGVGFDAGTELAVAAGMVALFVASLALLVLPRPPSPSVSAAVAGASAAPAPATPPVTPAAPAPTETRDVAPTREVQRDAAPEPAPSSARPPRHEEPHAHEVRLPIPPLPDVPPAEAELLVEAAQEATEADATAAADATSSPFPAREGGQGVRSPRVFVSHSSADNAFGEQLTAYLRDELGLDVFYDSDGGPTTDRSGGLIGGDDWQARIERELGERNTFVVILSPAALASQWVALELRTAFAQAVSIAGKVFIPVLHQPPSEVEVPLFMARYQWVAFAGRDEHAAYDELAQAVRLGQSRLRQDAGADLERLGPPFDLGVLTPTDHFVGREHDLA